MGLWLAEKDALFSTPKMYFLEKIFLSYEIHVIKLIIMINSHSIIKQLKCNSFCIS